MTTRRARRRAAVACAAGAGNGVLGARQTVEPAVDFTSTAAYSLALTATQ